jgi:hypothetical protein
LSLRCPVFRPRKKREKVVIFFLLVCWPPLCPKTRRQLRSDGWFIHRSCNICVSKHKLIYRLDRSMPRRRLGLNAVVVYYKILSQFHLQEPIITTMNLSRSSCSEFSACITINFRNTTINTRFFF